MTEQPSVSRRRKRLLRRVKRRAITSLIMMLAILVVPLIFSRYEDFNSIRRTVFSNVPFLQGTLFHENAILANTSIFYAVLLLLNLIVLFTWLITHEETKDRRLKKRIKRLDTIRFITFLVFVFVMMNTFFVSLATVSGPSMESTFLNDDDVLMRHFNVEYAHGDIVVVHVNQGLQESYFIKRLIGLPGDHVVIDQGTVYLNGAALDEPYLDSNTLTNCPLLGGTCDVVLEDGEFFVLGDNRQSSNDSRHLGVIDEDALYGQVFFRLRPLRRFGGIQ